MGDRKPWVPQEHFMQPISASARRWSTKQFKEVFPMLVATTLVLLVPHGLSPKITALLTTSLAQTHPPPPPSPVRDGEEKKGRQQYHGNVGK